ncbi:patatin [PVC group bacterium (ex Bugula neritina AB1)]|nr:patatin [PVC group bacterium (ex Bugula neritina AB1)]
MYPFKNLVFEGGGVKGLAYVGVMEILEKKGILQNIKRVAGTSAGAINATLFASGYTVEETRKEMLNLDFNDFSDSSWFPPNNLIRVFKEYGWNKGDFFKNWMGSLLKRKTGNSNITFELLQQYSNKSLYVLATNLSTRFSEIYSPEHTPNMPVVDAVRKSMSLPLFFRAVKNDHGDIFVDGGLLNNFPVKLFDREAYLDNKNLMRIPEYYEKENESVSENQEDDSHVSLKNGRYIYNKETLSFRVDTKEKISIFRDKKAPPHKKIDNFSDYITQLLKTLLSAQDNQHLNGDDWHRTIYVDSLDINTTDFDLQESQKKRLIESGKKSAKTYFEWWSDLKTDIAKNHPEAPC